ncbi:hypothetical protein Noc_1944 [Nitrosococcus oceani ATCC 19707]|uniref:Asparagine synthetase domain-containing protein n=2 Tax=Nitrosococcus oceani TaxID=1229 RepID=Q3J9U0_NITOC|nr:hypothetical protein [Nitrosococcus oceani]ABA58406.1 hypothetical protein Noc_1944 [Nitrosococcus oceani ATCC 19707]EDZ67333.1 hypothetical protein NOC27_660 [Nitrosococcus oceani AFC27]KFI19121.1 hypothetical protein IB75_10370 [Nitrosococcus oceani C-27]GEM18801.1 hypothetical protein NONS58_01620 [Nitrosococcus oceani]
MIFGMLTLQAEHDASQMLATIFKRIYRDGTPDQIRTFDFRLAITTIPDTPNSRPRINIIPFSTGHLIVLADILIGEYVSHLEKADTLSPDLPLAWSLPGRWIAITVPNDINKPIQWASDPIGAQWLYFTETSDGLVFSDCFWAVAKTVSRSQGIDPNALRHALVLGYNLREETIIPSIKLAPGGCIYEWDAGDFRIIRSHQLEYGDAMAGATEAEKIAQVEAAFHEAALSWKKVLPARTALSLSAGLDSRTALAYLQRAGVEVSFYTFGQPGSTEVIGAQSIAQRVGCSTRLFKIPDASWNDWETNIQTLGAIGPLQQSGWAHSWRAMLANKADAVVIGYLGDALTGKHLSSKQFDRSDWVNYWTHWSLNWEWQEWPGLRKKWRKDLSNNLAASFRQIIHKLEVAFPHQQAFHLDFYCRQRRWVASQPNDIGAALLPVCFFYHPAIWKVWANLPLSDLERQTLYRRTNYQLFPDLFRRPVSPTEELFQRSFRKFTRLLRRTNTDLLPSERPRVIDRWRALEINQQQIIVQLEHNREPLEEVVDVDFVLKRMGAFKSQRLSETECAMIMRIVNASHLVSAII